MAEWLFDEQVDERAVRRSVGGEHGFDERGAKASLPPQLAVRLYDLLVRDNRKWFDLFKGADLRLDVVVVQGNVLVKQPEAAYQPATFRFPDVRDNTSLGTDGLLVYFGRPRNFLDIAIMMSRDRADSDDLAAMLSAATGDAEFQAAMTALVGLATTEPHAAAVTAAIAGARALGELAYRAVRAVSGTTIGLYRGSRLAYPEQFGRGRNPPQGSYDRQHLSFWYQVEDAEPPVTASL